LVIFGIKFAPKGYIPEAILQNLAWRRESEIHTLMPNFTLEALQMCASLPVIKLAAVSRTLSNNTQNKMTSFTSPIKT